MNTLKWNIQNRSLLYQTSNLIIFEISSKQYETLSLLFKSYVLTFNLEALPSLELYLLIVSVYTMEKVVSYNILLTLSHFCYTCPNTKHIYVNLRLTIFMYSDSEYLA